MNKTVGKGTDVLVNKTVGKGTDVLVNKTVGKGTDVLVNCDGTVNDRYGCFCERSCGGTVRKKVWTFQ